MKLPAHVRAWIFDAEGGYGNDVNDRGGETKYGISKRQYPNVDIANLTRDDAEAIYARDYWDAVSGDLLPSALALAVFDAAVLQGPVTAIHMLQLALGKLGHDEVRADGIIGNYTLTAARLQAHADLPRLLATFMSFRGLRMFHDAFQNVKQRTFIRGWLARLFRLEAECLREVVTA